MSFNKITLLGNLGQDPELRYTPQGIAVCNFSLAINQKKKVGNEWKDQPLWFRIVLWRAQAENASKYLKKGSPIYIEGRLDIEEWTDKNNVPRTTLVVNATEMQFVGGGQKPEDNNQSTPEFAGPSTEQQTAQQAAQADQAGQAPATDDDIPF